MSAHNALLKASVNLDIFFRVIEWPARARIRVQEQAAGRSGQERQAAAWQPHGFGDQSECWSVEIRAEEERRVHHHEHNGAQRDHQAVPCVAVLH
jgi:hypothetical protein